MGRVGRVGVPAGEAPAGQVQRAAGGVGDRYHGDLLRQVRVRRSHGAGGDDPGVGVQDQIHLAGALRGLQHVHGERVDGFPGLGLEMVLHRLMERGAALVQTLLLLSRAFSCHKNRRLVVQNFPAYGV